MNRRPVVEQAQKIGPEFFLHTAADGHDDVARPALAQDFEEHGIGDFRAVIRRREIAVLARHRQALVLQPGEIERHRGGIGHDPKGRPRLVQWGLREQHLQILQAGNTRHGFAGHQLPQQDEQPAVGEQQIAPQHRRPVRRVILQREQHGCRRRHHQATLHRDLDGLRGAPNEKPQPENLPVIPPEISRAVALRRTASRRLCRKSGGRFGPPAAHFAKDPIRHDQ